VALRVIIVGAGIGGLTTAIALRDAGIEPVVYERAEALEQIQGRRSSIHLWTNGMRGLQRLGIGDRVAEVGAPFDRAQVESLKGRRLVDWPVAEMVQKLGAPTVGIIRADLHAVLADALGADAIRFGARCTGVDQTPDGILARFEDGGEERGDVLVAADGLTSTIRQQVLEDGPPVYTGRIQWQATLTPPEGLVPPRLYGNCWGRGRRFAFYPIPGGVCWYTMVSAPAGTSDPPGGAKAAVLAHYRGWRDPYEALIEATPEEAIDRLELVARRPGNRWVEGRVALLGDAAHAMPPDMGQGSALAIEDALVLAKHLAGGGDATAALRAYEDERLERVNRICRMAWRIARLGSLKNPLAVAARNGMIRLLSPKIAWNQHQQDMAYEF
jgi:2-polyprenyl-6-methoxyphenol hydroxylase-like FAD-dependent oxidoreductase